MQVQTRTRPRGVCRGGFGPARRAGPHHLRALATPQPHRRPRCPTRRFLHGRRSPQALCLPTATPRRGVGGRCRRRRPRRARRTHARRLGSTTRNPRGVGERMQTAPRALFVAEVSEFPRRCRSSLAMQIRSLVLVLAVALLASGAPPPTARMRTTHTARGPGFRERRSVAGVASAIRAIRGSGRVLSICGLVLARRKVTVFRRIPLSFGLSSFDPQAMRSNLAAFRSAAASLPHVQASCACMECVGNKGGI